MSLSEYWTGIETVLRRDLKTSNEGAEVTCWSKLFHMRATATGKARSPTVDSRVRRNDARCVIEISEGIL